jgi:hypothetical protein
MCYFGARCWSEKGNFSFARSSLEVHVRNLIGSLLFVLVVLGSFSCKKPTSPPPPPASGGCPGANAAPAFLIGSLDLTPTSAVIGTAQTVPKTLLVSMNGSPSLQLDFGGPVIGNDFEMCVITNPPAVKTHLGVAVTGVLEDPSGPGTGPVNFWQNVFATFFLNPLQNNQTSASGVLKIDDSAQSLRNAIVNAPPGYSSGRMLITIQLSDGPHKLDLTVAQQ